MGTLEFSMFFVLLGAGIYPAFKAVDKLAKRKENARNWIPDNMWIPQDNLLYDSELYLLMDMSIKRETGMMNYLRMFELDHVPQRAEDVLIKYNKIVKDGLQFDDSMADECRTLACRLKEICGEAPKKKNGKLKKLAS